MTLLGLLAAAYNRTRQAAAARSAYRDLRELDPRLLRDIGLRLEQGRVFPTTGINEPTTEETFVNKENVASEVSVAVISEKELTYGAEPEGAGG